MSPSEDQLRSALRHNEGGGLDVEQIVARAESARRERRVRLASAAAVVAIVAGVGTGVGITTRNSHSSTASKSADGYSVGAGAAARGTAAPSAVNGPVTVIPCAAQLHVPAVAVGTDTSRPFFSAGVSAVTVCAYRFTGFAVVRTDGNSGEPITATYAGADAAAIVTSLEQAKPTPSGASCGAIQANGVYAIAVLARYASGAVADPVIVGVGPCSGEVHNAHTSRYDWTQPRVLDLFMIKVRSAAAMTGPGSTATGGNSIEPTPTR
ncbi:MAG: hypothetical protein QOG80_3578 [Pseudonocardiales bacterium]|jgi:hypothetical protein|nr:hypothetical protein [Pseudonocardiales bacterium]